MKSLKLLERIGKHILLDSVADVLLLSNEKTIVSHTPHKERTAEKIDKSSLVDSLRDIAAEISDIVNNRTAEQDSRTQFVSDTPFIPSPVTCFLIFEESKRLQAWQRLRSRKKDRAREGREDECSRAALLLAKEARREDGEPALPEGPRGNEETTGQANYVALAKHGTTVAVPRSWAR